MRFYLSSYKLGNHPKLLKELKPKNNNLIAFIPNALDYSDDLERRKKSEKENKDNLEKLGFVVENIDLRKYFGKKNLLKKRLEKFGSFFVRGGNTFVLRQAMKLSGFDDLFKKMVKSKKDLLYVGYSAGVCILAPSLKGLDLVDDSLAKPYTYRRTIWSGLNTLDYLVVPHYKSNHPESEDMEMVVDYCNKNKIPFKTLMDGEVIIIK